MVRDEFVEEWAWSRALGLCFLEFSVVVYICYLALIVLFFYKREVGGGILCAACAVLCAPVGVMIALVLGWVNAGRWRTRAFMACGRP